MELESEQASRPQLNNELQMRRKQVRERDEYTAQYRQSTRELKPLRTKYPEEQVRTIRARERKFAQAASEAEQSLKSVDNSLRLQEAAVKEAEQSMKEAARSAEEVRLKLQEEQTREDELTRSVDVRRAALATEWQSAVETAGVAELATWRSELDSLANALEQLKVLSAARASQEARINHLAQIEQGIADVPDEARRPVEDLEREEKTAKENSGAAEEAREEAEQQKRDLESRRDLRADLETKRQEAALNALVYDRLAKLLGPDHLQRYLLTQAERAIVEHGNRVLDRISGGTLRLELANEREEGRGGGKALDLNAYNSETGVKPLPVAFLSGSQRFRVAVSLALGIGQYVGQGLPQHRIGYYR